MKILVPTDFSQNSIDALRYAEQMVKVAGGEIHVISAYQQPYTSRGSLVSLRQRLQRDAEAKMKVLEDKLREEEAMVKFTTYVRESEPVDLILQGIESLEIDLVVMGTLGSTGLEEVFIGSTAAAVIERASCPVLAVPKGISFKGWEKVVLAADLVDDSKEYGLELLQLTAPFDSEITLLHVSKSKSDARLDGLDSLALVMKEAGKGRIVAEACIENSDIRTGIHDYMIAQKGSVLAMVTKRRSLLGKLFDRSLTKKMANTAEFPILALHK